MKEALFYKRLKDKQVQCGLCSRRCRIAPGNTGFCRVRKNVDGRLFSLVYGKAVDTSIDNIEKKPFYHFAPGSMNLSYSTVGCNFSCKFCCNFPISQNWTEVHGKDIAPKEMVDLAKQSGVQGIAHTYVEPTIFFEYARDIGLIAKRAGLYNVFVTNGYTTPEAIKEASKFLDAAVIDFKNSANPEAYRKLSSVPDVEPIFQAIEEYKKRKVFIEITNLIIPKYGDDPKDMKRMCKRIVDIVGNDVPLHVIQFFPSYKLTDVGQTSVKALEKMYVIAKESGMNYVYVGNVPGHKRESTYCPKCGSLAIERYGIKITSFLLDSHMKCRKCGSKIPIAGKKWMRTDSF